MRPLYHPAALRNLNLDSGTKNLGQDCRSNLALCGDTSSFITVESEVEQAEEIFHRLFPLEVFLPPIIDVNGDDDDEGRG